ncbi:DNA-binding transcriptional regulator, MerR family [Propionibacterium cyclohexanicum]|uniref:DNA-binding transcriptional regulator, MerR family n=2 Tax=Propionibacterium cyclohexanicum TaxID=64702 RepID=A0A1H9Q003_9ACTN|nr:DNA-binding transcriptional regulator, MerR family [Propionibacterium cyclohexanicum]
MRIGEFARRGGVSPRALRHYEQSGLLVARRTSSGYRDYDEDQLESLARIRVILDAGLGTAAARSYLDCVELRGGATRVHMCPQLLERVRALEQRIADNRARVQQQREAVTRFVAAADRD